MTNSRTKVSFYSFNLGLLLGITQALVFAATQDLLADTLIPSSTILTLNITPQLIVQLMVTYCLPQGYLSLKVLIILVSHVGGFGLIIFSHNVYASLCGVAISAIGIGLGYPTFFALISRYGQRALIMNSCGAGLGVFIPQLTYTGLTTWFGVSPRMSMGIISCGLPLAVVNYYLLNKIPPESSNADSPHSTAYQPLKTEEDNSNRIDSTEIITIRERIIVTGQISVVNITCFIIFFVYYICMKSIATTLAYPESPFSPRDSYQYNSICFSFGNVIGTSYLPIFKGISTNLYSRTVVHRVWGFGVISVVLVLIFLFESWYRFIHNAWVIMGLAFMVGLNMGVAYGNSVVVLSECVKSRYLAFALSTFSVALTLGKITAALLGFHIEPQLYERCTEISPSTEYCLTRNMMK